MLALLSELLAKLFLTINAQKNSNFLWFDYETCTFSTVVKQGKNRKCFQSRQLHRHPIWHRFHCYRLHGCRRHWHGNKHRAPIFCGYQNRIGYYRRQRGDNSQNTRRRVWCSFRIEHDICGHRPELSRWRHELRWLDGVGTERKTWSRFLQCRWSQPALSEPRGHPAIRSRSRLLDRNNHFRTVYSGIHSRNGSRP